MSKKIPAQLGCPKCSHQFPVQLFRSIWVEYPENRQLILEDKINRFPCPKCGHNVWADYPFLATNVQRKFAVWYEPYPDKNIDKDVVYYQKHMGANSFYAVAPRITDWNMFKQKLLEMETQPPKLGQGVIPSDEMSKSFAGFIAHISRKKYKISKAIPEATAIALLLWALLPSNPYGFYTFMRLVVFGVAGYLAFRAKEKSWSKWMYILGGIALLYNPFIKVHLDKESWVLINIITAVLIGRFSWMMQKRN